MVEVIAGGLIAAAVVLMVYGVVSEWRIHQEWKKADAEIDAWLLDQLQEEENVGGR